MEQKWPEDREKFVKHLKEEGVEYMWLMYDFRTDRFNIETLEVLYREWAASDGEGKL